MRFFFAIDFIEDELQLITDNTGIPRPYVLSILEWYTKMEKERLESEFRENFGAQA